jgi:thiamine-phosphate pyrophosphorylase
MLRYAITARRRFGVDEASRANALVAQAERLAARGDVDYLQLRQKNLPPGELATLARRILKALRTHAADPARRPRLLINSRADVASAVRADGVHLTSSPGELTPEQVRALYAEAGLPLPTVSLSCHTLAEVIAARGLRAGFGSGDALCFAPDPATTPDLILFGPVFEKRIGDEPVAEGSGLKLLREACAAAAPIPVLALGGVTEENSAACLEAGVSGIAGIRLFSA